MVVPFMISDFSQLLVGAFWISLRFFYILNSIYYMVFMYFSFFAKNTRSNRILRCLFGLSLIPFYMIRASMLYAKTGQIKIFTICLLIILALLCLIFLARELIRKK